MSDTTKPRDFAADLATCEAASGPLPFAVASRTGWPIAIREAMRVEGLEHAIATLNDRVEDLMAERALLCRENRCAARKANADNERAEKAEADADALRECLRYLLDAKCDTSGGEYGAMKVREAMDEVHGDPRALLARAEALLAVKEVKP